jgi:outer membrane lipoprotein carrier protein
MKKIAITCALLQFYGEQRLGDAASDLKSRLDKVSSFHASFTQKVTDGSGNGGAGRSGRFVGKTSKSVQLAYDPAG